MEVLKRWCILLAALFSFSSVALAEYYEGKTAALSTVTVCAEADGRIEAVRVLEGQRVAAGEALFRLRSERTFSSQDGTVSLVNAGVGDSVDGTVVEIMPTERYTVYCTVDNAYQSAASTLVHSGETVYIKCTKDGSHRAVGVVTQIDGAEYRVLTLAGQEDEDAFGGTVVEISAIAQSDGYTVRIRPETDMPLPLGMGVGVRL